MTRLLRIEKMHHLKRPLLFRLWMLTTFVTVLSCGNSWAGVPVTQYASFAGNINFTGTGGSLRTQSDAANPCTVTNSGIGNLSGIPATATITAAYLYWAGSYDTGQGVPPDYNVTLNGSNLSADRTFTEMFPYTNNLYFFSGFKDVTTIVASTGNGNYTFNNLAVNSGFPHCNVSAVLSGWSLVVIYEDAAEPLRVINVYDGFQYYRGSQITLTPSNFLVPNSGIDGKQGHISWEGDVGNSATLGGFTEDLLFNGNALTDALNPANNQFNSTINLIGSSTTFGVDHDVYDITAYLSPGDTSATSVYSSGADLVLLSAEVISVTNTPVADLAVNKSHSGDFTAGSSGLYTILVSNNGPNTAASTITVTDTLPAGLTYLSSSGSGWVADTSASPTITWTHAGPLAASASLPAILLSVGVQPAAVPTVTNTAAVASSTFDNISANDTSGDLTTVNTDPILTITKTTQVISDPVSGGVNPKAIPGAEIEYTLLVTNTGLTAASTDSVIITDPVPSGTELFVGDLGGAGQGPVIFSDGVNASGLTYSFIGLGSFTDDVDFSNNGGSSFAHVPSPDGDGYDTTVPPVDWLLVNPKGAFSASDGVNHPSFTIRYRIRVR